MSTDSDEKLKELLVGLHVAIGEIATLRLLVTEQSIAIEKLIALQKDLLTRPTDAEPKTRQAIEDRLRELDSIIRRSVLDRLKHGPLSSSQDALGSEDPKDPSNN